MAGICLSHQDTTNNGLQRSGRKRVLAMVAHSRPPAEPKRYPTESMHYIERLAKHWKSIGVSQLPPSYTFSVDDFAKRHGIHIPKDFREFYTFCDGIENTDGGLNAFWPLSEVDTVPAKLCDFSGAPDYSAIADNLPNADDYFVFADHSIWVCVYAIMLTDDPNAPTPVLWIGDGRSYDTIANSFTDFWLRYTELPDDKCLWP